MAHLAGLRDAIAARGLARAAAAVESAAQQTRDAAPRGETGRLGQGIEYDPPSLVGDQIVTQIRSTEPYSEYVERGTGVYGPGGQRIFPVTAKALSFVWHGVRVTVRSIAGARAQPFFHDQMPQRWHDGLGSS